MIRILATIFAGLLGLAFGSFLNVCLSRWPRRESIVRPGSRCMNCGRTLAWWENVPLVSWLALRGRCRTCGVSIGVRYVLVEAAVGGLWALLGWRTCANTSFSPAGFTVHVVGYGLGFAILCWLLIALATLDAEHLWLPDFLTLPGIALGLLLAAAMAAVSPQGHAGWALLTRVGEAAAAAGLILLIRWTYWLAKRREGIGLGDAKLMALLAAWLGLPGTMLAFVVGVVLGALVAVSMLLVPRSRRRSWALTRLPLGTFLCIGGIFAALWGRPVVNAYLRLVGLG